MAGEWARVGAKCVCINVHNWNFKNEANLKAAQLPNMGEIYIIREVRLGGNGDTGVMLEGLDNSHIPTKTGEEISFRIHRFRPLVTKTMEQDLEQFKHLLNPTPLERLDRLAELLDLGY